MLLIFKKVSFLVGLTLFVIDAHSQIVSSTRNGDWDDPATWIGGVIPSSVNASQVVVNHAVVVSDPLPVVVFRLMINGQLTLEKGSSLQILPDSFPEIPDLQVNGTLVLQDSASLTGTSADNARFESGSQYVHRQGPLGFVPMATWDDNSTFVIGGFTTSGYINIAHSDGWKQSFGHVVYDCPLQTIFVVDLNGYLKDVRGDFTIRSTNGQTLRLSTTQGPTISIGGDLTIEGDSEVWVGTNGKGTTMNVGGNFNYRSVSAGASYLTTRGTTTLNVAGDLLIDASGPIRMTSSSTDSTGIRSATIQLAGDLNFLRGGLIAPPAGVGTGELAFVGDSLQRVLISSTASISGHVEYVVGASAIVELGESALVGEPGGLSVEGGTLVLGSTHPQGALQSGGGGNVRVSGSRWFAPGSTIVYRASTPQVVGDVYPMFDGVNLVCENATTLTSLSSLTVTGDLTITSGSLIVAPHDLTVAGNFSVATSSSVDLGTLRLTGDTDQFLSLHASSLSHLIVDKGDHSLVRLMTPLSMTGVLEIESPNTHLVSDGFLTLRSFSDDETLNGCVGPLPPGSDIIGDVQVERFMSGEGRIYRYLSSPVQAATVASLMDDFPVTGRFSDPTTGPGINSKAPSLYYYDEAVGALQEGWQPFPSAGAASQSVLEPGKGYAAFIRRGVGPTVWDVTGVLNQGEISLPVAHTNGGAPSNGWNLIGNPYACPIDWDIDGSQGWTKTNISQVISIRDNGGGGIFRYWDGDGAYNDLPGGRIATGQSFWVRTTGQNPVLTIREGVKVPIGTSFFRQAAPAVPSLVIKLRKGDVEDRAYWKVRKSAKNTLDSWDAVKLDNDSFDVCWRLEDGILVAINAVDQLPCHGLVIPVVTKDLEPGVYSFSYETKYDFERYELALLDRYTGQMVNLSEGTLMSFVVGDDVKSAAADRFSLKFSVREPETTRVVNVSPARLVEGEDLEVIIHDADPYVTYALEMPGGQRTTGLVHGGSSEVHLMVSSNQLTLGMNNLRILASVGCTTIALDTVLTVEMVPGDTLENSDANIASIATHTGSPSAYLYPNPAHALITVESGDVDASLRIVSVTGESLDVPHWGEREGDVMKLSAQIDKLCPGIYLAIILVSGQPRAIRFLKQ